MPEQFIRLGIAEQNEVLETAAANLGRPQFLLEKDVWVVWTLDALFSAPFGPHLVFKGGTSLSKANGGVVDRFSEDIDLTYDIRELLGLENRSKNPIPPNPSQRKRWLRHIGEKLPVWIERDVLPWLQARIDEQVVPLSLSYDRGTPDVVLIEYPRQMDYPEYVSPTVKLEFGARSTGEPATEQDVVCDAAGGIDAPIDFPTARPRVMHVTRTFWEKATAAHVFCLSGRFRGDKFARHWFDLAKLWWSNGASLVDDRATEIARDLADHKDVFFAEKDANGHGIDYHAAAGGALKLVPDGRALEDLRSEYQAMVEGGLLREGSPTIDQVLEACRQIEEAANRRVPVR